jgi:hypothetical protein
MKNFVVIFLIQIILTSCMPVQEIDPITENGLGTGTGSTPNSTNTSGESSVDFAHDISWYSSSKYMTSLIVNSDDKRTFYMRGSEVNSFLEKPDNFQIHCLILDFTTPLGENSQMRVRAVPQTINHYSSNKIEKYFRIDLTSNASNKANCKGDDIFPDTEGKFLLDNLVDEDTAHYTPSTICDGCVGKLNARTIRMKKSVYDGSNWIIDPSYSNINLDLAKINLTINMNNDSNNDNPNCTNTECQAQGFDCCLDGQCVNDGAVRPGAEDLDGYDNAIEFLLTNPGLYSDYSQFFYVCQTIIVDDGTGDTGSTTDDTNTNINAAQEAFNNLKNDYNCIKEMKEQASSQPFHLNPYNEDGEYEFCDTDDETNPMYYTNVLKRIYDNCGCVAGELDDRINNCPNYEYEGRNFDEAQEPTQIVCKTPEIVQDVPFKDLTVAVPSRSAPHRFFDSETGDEYFELSSIFASNIESEGQSFFYQDSAKILPLNGSFNMNSILGQFSVMLNQALPAKKIDVEEGTTYVVNTISGYYTPCPTCAKDSWMTAFTAWPTTLYGTGLQAVGYTTQRDNYAYNSTFGNYEDTIFGRACFLPPTMLPYSHLDRDEIAEQRQARLKTQASLYINGYQRDWFGFNQGALIGSFDGVKWFAVGKGRLVTATTDKLFLAINAPYADLNSPTTHSVSIQEYKGVTSAATVDYDPNKTFNDARQNEAATCQRFHSCEADSDCISQLGWEYVCADVRKSKTYSPAFGPEANEKPEGYFTSIEGILKQNGLPSGSSKRCVYRGRGSICRKDSQNVSDAQVRKLLTCAPNFYCAGLDAEVYSKEVTRMVGGFDSMPFVDSLFGRDANILGRPFKYIGDDSTLPDEVVENLVANIALTDEEADGNEGICMPGKSLPSDTENPFEAHGVADDSLRTDYISQIGGCDSENASENKYVACPVLDSEGNYLVTSANFLADMESDEDAAMTSYKVNARGQNMCGGEAKSEDDANPFALIEALSIGEGTKVNSPTLVKDACYRRAGSVCHTDLDCAPNKLHREQIDQFGGDLTNYFGNVAEQKYWEESLVCGQATAEPNIYDPYYTQFDMKKNRCCREIGSDITLYSESTPGVEESENLNTKLDAYLNPSEAERYSRYSVIPSEHNGVSGYASIDGGELDERNDINLLLKGQWKTVGTAASKTCCGGGWIRKFADGTNDWTKKRLSLDVTNFRCINYQSPLLLSDNPTGDYGINTLTYSKEYSLTCAENEEAEDPATACMQIGMNPISEGFIPIAPVLNTSTSDVNVKTYEHIPTKWSPYAPLTGDGIAATFFDHSMEGAERTRNYLVRIRLPLYIDPSTLASTLNVTESKTLGINKSCTIAKVPSCAATFDQDSTSGFSAAEIAATTVQKCLACLDTTQGILKVKQIHFPGGADHVISFKFKPRGTAANPGSNGVSSAPGNIFYYLRKLGKLELTGVPQVFYEPLTCNSQYKEIVPGIFKSQIKTMSNYSTDSYSFKLSGNEYNLPSTDPTNPNKRASTAQALDHDKIFSSHEMKCCIPLGESSTDSASCRIPKGADISVYFNRFISGEGAGPGMPGGGFRDEDFDENTGEPKLTEEVYQKLNSMGTEWCESSRTRRGGAFGAFPPEPSGTTSLKETSEYSIVDSYRDEADGLNQSGNGAAGTVGFEAFSKGFRWNHHVYCDE